MNRPAVPSKNSPWGPPIIPAHDQFLIQERATRKVSAVCLASPNNQHFFQQPLSGQKCGHSGQPRHCSLIEHCSHRGGSPTPPQCFFVIQHDVDRFLHPIATRHRVFWTAVELTQPPNAAKVLGDDTMRPTSASRSGTLAPQANGRWSGPSREGTVHARALFLKHRQNLARGILRVDQSATYSWTQCRCNTVLKDSLTCLKCFDGHVLAGNTHSRVQSWQILFEKLSPVGIHPQPADIFDAPFVILCKPWHDWTNEQYPVLKKGYG